MKNKLGLCAIVLLFVPATVQAQESEFKDTPWFSGMPNYLIYDAEETEFDAYNFFNGKNCSKVEGKKFKRIYSLKEDAQKSSVIQIMRNYANAIKNNGGTVIYEGMPQNAECADNNGLNMVVGKAVRDGNELWVVSAIVSQGIAAERLSPAGYGQDKPIGDNNTEEGKAKNRRVELVRK